MTDIGSFSIIMAASAAAAAAKAVKTAARAQALWPE